MNEPTPSPAPTPAPSPAPAVDPTPAPAPAPAATAAPEGPLAQFWNKDAGSLDLEALGSAFAERDAVFAQHSERMKGVPKEAKEYKVEPILPEGITLPEGAKLQFDETAVAAATNIAHQLGVPQESFSKLLGVVAAHEVQKAKAAIAEHQTMLAEEVKKLGGEDAAKARRAPIEAYGQANFTKDEQAEMRLLLSTSAGVSLLEKMIRKANGTAIPARVDNTTTPAPEPLPTKAVMYPSMQRKG